MVDIEKLKKLSHEQINTILKELVTERIITLSSEVFGSDAEFFTRRGRQDMFFFNWDLYAKYYGNPYLITGVTDAATEAALQSGR